MHQKSKQLYYVWEIYKKFSFSSGTQICLITLDLVAKGTKLILAYVYLYLFEHIEKLSFKRVFFIGILTLLTIAVCQVALLSYHKLYEQCFQNKLLEIHNNLFAAHEYTRLSCLENYKSGKWLSLMGTDAQVCAGIFGNTIVPLMRGIILFIGALFMGIFISPIMMLIVLACSMTSGFLMKYLQNKIFSAYEEKSAGKDVVQSSLLGLIDMVETIKSYQYERKSAQGFSSIYGHFAEKSIAAAKNANLLVATSIGSGFTISTLWMVIGIFSILKGSLTIGAFSAFMMLSDYFNWPFFNVPTLFADAIESMVSYDRLCEFQAMDKESKSENIYTETGTRLELCNVNFSYNKTIPVIHGLNYKITKGQKVALIGESGAGKSTLVKLMLGLYYPDSGEVSVFCGEKRLQGQSIQDSISYVPQTPSLFNATVVENIQLGNPKASIEDIERAAKIACAHDFIVKLPDGYQTLVGNSAQIKLSGGQIQRIALARALVKQSSIYIMDEITSALDSENESKVIHNLISLPQTMIFIAHKQALIDACDTVIQLTKPVVSV